MIARLTCKSASLLSPDEISNWIMDNINNRTRTLTAEIVKDFIIHRLQKAGYENDIPGGSQLSFEAPGPAYRSMRMMGDEFYTAYFNAFEDMTGTINIHNGDLKDIFFTILEQTCETGLNWGRMVGMFVFSAMIAVKAMACGRTDVVENIIEWASDYLEHERFSNWINQHGGWVSE